MTSGHFSSPQAAETAFYGALERADLEAMMAVWGDADDIACIHPGGRRLSGRAAIRASWQQMFTAGPHLRFSITHRHTIADDALVVHIVDEHIEAGARRYPPVITTNVYRLTQAGWQIVLHHACPSPPAADPDKDNGRLH
ncbi:MAG: nuclear transport factor 2 family protein [Gammaproteobacteria bacterium]